MSLYSSPSPSPSTTTNHPLFCCIITLYTLLFIYSPPSLNTSLSPLLTLTSLLLLSLLRLGSLQQQQLQQQQQTQSTIHPQSPQNVECSENASKVAIFEPNPGSLDHLEKWVSEFSPGCDPVDTVRPLGSSKFVEWDVSAPLEVIYEVYEGEEEDGESGEDPNRSGFDSTRLGKYPSLSMYYPETDSDSSEEDSGGVPVIGEWESPERVCFKWEEEDKEELLIEIALEGVIEKKNPGPGQGSISGSGSSFHVEEDNLIEIDISPEKTMSF